MNFLQYNLMSRLFVVLFFLSGFQSIVFSQSCPNSWNEWQWPTHSNWFVGQGNKVNFGSGTSAPTASNINPSAWAPVYESTAAASDNDGNLVIFTNGVKLFDGTGAEIAVPGGRLLTGSESIAGDAGSAVQGVFIAKHPLDNENYYIFTTDDAILGANGTTRGFNYFVYNKTTNTCSGATRLGNYRCSEQVAGTFHSNGIDVWISTHESTAGGGSDVFKSYLLTCDGLNEVAVESSTGFKVLKNTSNERASLQFSWDGTKAGATYHNGNGNWDPDAAVQLLDFDNATGMFSNAQDVSPNDANHSNPYDCEFSPSGDRLYISYQCGTGGEIGYVDVSSGSYVGALSFDANEGGGLKLGGDGKIYTGTFKDCAGWAYGNSVGAISNPDGVPSYDGDAVMTPNSVGWGLGNMFIAPQDWVEIQDPQPLTECDLPVDLQTNWLCKGTSAENTPRYENAYSLPTTGPNVCGACSVDPVTGVFDAPGPGTYEVHFEICEIRDTIIFNVGVCGCDADVDGTASICAGETVNLDDFIVSASGDGVWTVDSVPSTPGVDPSIDDTGADTLFDASNPLTKYGTYKLKFRVDDTCEDSLYIEVKKIPTVKIDQFGPLCDDSVAVNMNAIPGIVLGGDVVGGWAINGFPQLDDVFNPITLGAGVHKVLYGVDSLGCLNADSINVFVKERPHPEIVQVGPYCANDPAVNLTITPAAGDTGVWTVSSGIDALGKFTPSNAGAGDKDIFYTIYGQCGNDTTIQIHVDPVKDATIATPDSTVCENEPAINLLTGDLTGTWFVNDTMPGSELGGTAFDPSTFGSGVYKLIYRLPNPCGDLDTITIIVNPVKDASITTTDITYCAVDTVINLLTTNAGGVWYKGDTLAGSELGANSINPSEHTGTFKIYYYMNGQCGHVDSINVTVDPLKDATIVTPKDSMNLCILDANPTFTVAEAGGTWNNAAVNQVGTDVEIDLATLGIVVNEMLIYSQASPCGDKDTIWVTTTNQLDATISQVGPFCDDADSVKLQVVDAGGVFAGDGVDPLTGWFDPVEAGPGVHNITYTIPGNCGDVKDIDITVNRTPDPTIQNVNFDFCEDHGDEILYTNEPGGAWIDIDGANGALNSGAGTFNTVTSGPGSFRLEYGFAGDCPAFDTIEFTIIQLPVVTISEEDTLCEDNPIINFVYNVEPSSSIITWNGGDNNGGFNPLGNLGDNNISLSADNNGCESSDQITVHVLPRADATIKPIGPFCASVGGAVQLKSVSGQYGTWSGIGVTDSEKGVFDVQVAGPGVFEIRHEIAGRCDDWDTVLIEVIGTPDPTINPVAAVCPGSDPIQFTAASDGGIWAGDGIDQNTGVFTPETPGVYNINYVITKPCLAIGNYKFEVLEIPETDFSVAPRTGCVPLEVTFMDESEEVPSQSTWDFGNSQFSNEVGNVNQTYESVNCFDVTLTNIFANGCKSEKTLTDAVCSHPIPEANFNWNPTVLDVEKNRAVFENLSSSDAEVFLWSFEDTLRKVNESMVVPTDYNSANPIVDFNSTNGGTIMAKLKVINEFGCEDSIEKPITILDKFSLFVPNAFTPNNDGLNDEFYPVGRNLAGEGEYYPGDDYEFRIYNRWGTLIWMSETPGEGWDGTVTELSPTSGEVAQIDVYVWRLFVRDPFTGDKHLKVGRVSLIR